MKNALLLSLTLFLVINLQAQDKDHFQLLQNEQNWAKNVIEMRGPADSRGFDVVHQKLDIIVDPAINAIAGSVTTSFTVEKDSLTEVILDLFSLMSVDSIYFNGNSISYSHENDEIIIPFENALLKDNLEKIQIFYHGVPPSSSGFRSFVQTYHGQSPVVWTLSEPYGAYEWWPCKQDLSDKIDSLDMIVTVPEGNKVGSNGLLIEEFHADNMATYHWKHKYPIPTYLVAFATTNYVEYTDIIPVDGGEDITMLNYVYPESLVGAKRGTNDLIKVMQLFNDLFGLYPFADEKYGHAQFGWGGGMEHTTMTFCVNFGHGLLSHELAHQWFGDSATCGSWEDIWLNEGFATYLEGLTYEHGLGYNTFDNYLIGKINTIISQPGGSVHVSDTTNVRRIFDWRLSYSKGAMVLHMLRWQVGDDAFFQGVRNYLTDPDIQYGFGRTKQLQTHIEETSGQELTEFFDSWYYGEGYPMYNITWWQNYDNVLHIEVKQEQSVSASYFKMPVPVQVYTPNNREIMVLQNDSDGQIFDFPMDSRVDKIDFDPNHWLVATSNVNQVISNTIDEAVSKQIKLAPNPVQDILRIELANLEVESFEIYDYSGKLILQSEVSFRNKSTVNVEQLTKGTYQLICNTKEGKGAVSFVKL